MGREKWISMTIRDTTEIKTTVNQGNRSDDECSCSVVIWSHSNATILPTPHTFQQATIKSMSYTLCLSSFKWETIYQRWEMQLSE